MGLEDASILIFQKEKMIVSDKYNFVFVHIPKTGGTSVKKALFDYYNDGQIEFEGEKVTDIADYHPHIVMGRDEYLKYQNYFKFVIVRNPWSWHASIWKFFQRPDRNNRIISKITFEDYITLIYKGEKKIVYTRNQLDWFFDFDKNIPLVDFIIRFENINKEFKKVLKKIKLHKKKIMLPHYKKSDSYNYRDMYKPYMVEMIREHNIKDIEYFNYKF